MTIIRTVARDKWAALEKILLALVAIVVGIHHGESSSSSMIASFSYQMKKNLACRNVDIHPSNDCIHAHDGS
jgi:hypothetical protein